MNFRVKVFIAAHAEILEADINNWLGKNYIMIKDIKYTEINKWHSAMIIYTEV